MRWNAVSAFANCGRAVHSITSSARASNERVAIGVLS
jgi:hypothetical protein